MPERESEQRELAKRKFLQKNPEYGYGAVDNTSSSSNIKSNNNRSSNDDSTPATSATTAKKVVIDSIRESDFPRLLQPLGQRAPVKEEERRRGPGVNGLVYLDHAGATLYGVSQLREAMEPLLQGVHGNPHSQV